jgi:hypothetical protein
MWMYRRERDRTLSQRCLYRRRSFGIGLSHFGTGWSGRICSRLKIDPGIEIDARVDCNQMMCLQEQC